MDENWTINYGSVLHVYCIGYTDTLTISVPLQVLSPLGADFDGKLKKTDTYYTIIIVLCTLPSLNLLNCWKLLMMYIYYNVICKDKRDSLRNIY